MALSEVRRLRLGERNYLEQQKAYIEKYRDATLVCVHNTHNDAGPTPVRDPMPPTCRAGPVRQRAVQLHRIMRPLMSVSDRSMKKHPTPFSLF
ncbi:hypothetical protein EVAR_44603_1 [Eumeta japonica]|uniref:Uncharacterized protein n=1 Tax=Eumeta variegata TaxID=151549 RepID=A0A4C1X8T7_EUMVA|nr:hypothetical protein EVAR_44603_1 [Eumeta japonica]